jgi:ABC-2 type transport system permease protein
VGEQPAPRGVIHDIGYRPYEGPRLDRGPIRRALAVQGLGHCFGFGRSGRSRIVPVTLVVVMTLPAFVVVGALVLSGADPLIPPTRYAYSLQLVVALFLAAQAPQMFSRDLRYRAIVLYLSRPLTRMDYVVARLLALGGAVLVFVLIPVVLIAVGGLLAGRDYVDVLTELGQAAVGALLLAVLLAAVGGLIAALTPRRGFAVAAIIAVVLISSTAVTIVREIIRSEGSPDSLGLDYISLASPFGLAEQVQAVVARAPDPLPVTPALTHVGTYAVLVAGCVWLLRVRYERAGRS